MRSELLAMALVGAALAFAALAFGAVDPWAIEIVLLVVTGAVALVFWNASPREMAAGPPGRLAVAGALIIAWGLLQTAPLPHSVLSAITPRTASLFAGGVTGATGEDLPARLLDRAREQGIAVRAGAVAPTGAADAGDRFAGRSISLDRFATRRACVAWLVPLLAFLAVARLARDVVPRYRLLWVIAATIGCVALIALGQSISGTSRMLWIFDAPAGTRPIAAFVNPNHFAAFMNVGLLTAIGLLLAHLADPDGRVSIASVRASLLDAAWRLPRVLGLGAIVILCATALASSRSRGAALALACGVAVLLARRRAAAVFGFVAIAAALAGVSAGLAARLGADNVGGVSAAFSARGSDASASERVDTWGRTLAIVQDHPLTGTGLGTFGLAYGSYQREGEWLNWGQAHNDYLQLVSETGIVGGALLAFGLYALLRGVFGPAMRRRGAPPRWTTIGCAAAVVATLAHAVFDFGLQIPAVALAFAVVLGVLASAAREVPADEATP